MKLVSILMPTRTAVFSSLRRAVNSILETAGDNWEQVEILLRLDDDDIERVPVAMELTKGTGKFVVGPRGRGYLDMGVFVDDLVKVAKGKWCWLFDDDAWVQGDWFKQLSELRCDPHSGPAANAQNYQLGGSLYRNGPNGGPVGMLVPTAFCRTLHHQNPVDQQWLNEIMGRGWFIQQLLGVTYHHDGRKR